MNHPAIKVKKAILLIGDIIMLYLSLAIALYFRYWPDFTTSRFWDHFLPFTIIYLTWLLIFFISGLYDLNYAKNTLAFYATLTRALITSALAAIAFFYLIPYFGITPKTNLALNIIILAILIYLWRQLFNKTVKSQALLNDVLLIGSNRESEQLVRHIKENPQLGYRVKKAIAEDDTRLLSELAQIVVQEKIQTIVTVSNPRASSALSKNLYNCLPLKVSLFDLPRFYELITGKIPVSVIEETWFLENLMNEQKNIYEVFKRIIDFFLALILGTASLLLYPFIALAIKVNSRGPVFYTQKRVGQDSQIFEIIKFRSMVNNAETNGAQWAVKKDPRVTGAGKFLRKTRLDEIPQLWNILKGEMSFVGPRPERPEFVFGTNMEREIPFYQIRHLVKPGLTGWAQINFEYGSSYEDTIEKLQYDFFYLKNRSFILDLSIILKTVKIIISREGV
jgi:exopolysaccharide biosynthesis polyprenyl glycosylphosphotransferase